MSIYLGLGANLPSVYGSPLEAIGKSWAFLENSGIKILKKSSVWLSEPVPKSDQDWYHNAVIEVSFSGNALELIDKLLDIEAEHFGRIRTVPNAPRTLDLDIVDFNGEIISSEMLDIPHKRLHERAFVLYPLQEVAPNWTHPVSGKSIETLISELSNEYEIRKLTDNHE